MRQETVDLLSRMYQDRVNGYVFTNPSAFYWDCKTWMSEIVQKSMIEPCGLHDLRRTGNTMILDAGFSRETAMQVLGQKSARVNADYYTGMLKKQQRTAIDSLPSIG